MFLWVYLVFGIWLYFFFSIDFCCWRPPNVTIIIFHRQSDSMYITYTHYDRSHDNYSLPMPKGMNRMNKWREKWSKRIIINSSNTLNHIQLLIRKNGSFYVRNSFCFCFSFSFLFLVIISFTAIFIFTSETPK